METRHEDAGFFKELFDCWIQTALEMMEDHYQEQGEDNP